MKLQSRAETWACRILSMTQRNSAVHAVASVNKSSALCTYTHMTKLAHRHEATEVTQKSHQANLLS